MRPTAVVFATMLVLLLGARGARADGVYATIDAMAGSVGDDFGDPSEPAGATDHRAGVGVRLGRFALEAWAASGRIEVGCTDGYWYGPGGTTASRGVDLRYLRTLSSRSEWYVRGRMSTMAFTATSAATYAGRGLGAAVGLQVHPGLTGRRGAVFVELGYDFYRLHGDAPSLDGNFTRLVIGVAFGSDT